MYNSFITLGGLLARTVWEVAGRVSRSAVSRPAPGRLQKPPSRLALHALPGSPALPDLPA